MQSNMTHRDPFTSHQFRTLLLTMAE